MQLGSLIQRTFKGIWSPDNSTTPRPNDREEDGFLVVGQTSSERSTVTAGEFSGQQDAPPDYSKTIENEMLPSYKEFSTSPAKYVRQTSAEYSPTDAVLSHHGGFRGYDPPEELEGHSAHGTAPSLLSDVPFKLNDRLELVQDYINGTDRQNLCKRQKIDWVKYQYDFTLEISVLRDLVCSDSDQDSDNEIKMEEDRKHEDLIKFQGLSYNI